MQLVKVELVPANKSYIYLRTMDGRVVKVDRLPYSYLRTGDVCEVIEQGKRIKLRLLTEDDEAVILNHPDRKQMVPYGFFDRR